MFSVFAMIELLFINVFAENKKRYDNGTSINQSI